MDWSGGFYATTSLAGSRPGATIAGTWAALVKLGHKEYVEQAKRIFQAQENIAKAIREECPEVRVGTVHCSPLISLVSKEGKDQINCIALADVLHKHFNWTLNKSVRPSGAKLVISEDIAPEWENFVQSVKGAIKMLKE
jgi:sphinganine-1-phosphate aldolase